MPFIRIMAVVALVFSGVHAGFAPAQNTALVSSIAADPTLGQLTHTGNNADIIAAAYNLTASPQFTVWKTKLMEVDLEANTSPEGTVWSWTIYIGRSQAERDAYRQMFNKGVINPALPQVQAAFTDIFSGAGGQAQRTHALAMMKRDATRVEKLFATGTGSLASPATLTFEGVIQGHDILVAWGMD